VSGDLLEGAAVEGNLWLKTKGALPLEGSYKIRRGGFGSAAWLAIIKSALVIVIIAERLENRREGN